MVTAITGASRRNKDAGRSDCATRDAPAESKPAGVNRDGHDYRPGRRANHATCLQKRS